MLNKETPLAPLFSEGTVFPFKYRWPLSILSSWYSIGNVFKGMSSQPQASSPNNLAIPPNAA